MYYYGAKYLDTRNSIWLGVDPLADRHLLTKHKKYALAKIVNISSNYRSGFRVDVEYIVIKQSINALVGFKLKYIHKSYGRY